MKDKPELYTIISIGLLFGMFPVCLLSVYFNSMVGIPIILGFIIISVYLMYKRRRIEIQNLRSDKQ